MNSGLIRPNNNVSLRRGRSVGVEQHRSNFPENPTRLCAQRLVFRQLLAVILTGIMVGSNRSCVHEHGEF